MNIFIKKGTKMRHFFKNDFLIFIVMINHFMHLQTGEDFNFQENSFQENSKEASISRDTEERQKRDRLEKLKEERLRDPKTLSKTSQQQPSERIRNQETKTFSQDQVTFRTPPDNATPRKATDVDEQSSKSTSRNKQNADTSIIKDLNEDFTQDSTFGKALDINKKYAKIEKRLTENYETQKDLLERDFHNAKTRLNRKIENYENIITHSAGNTFSETINGTLLKGREILKYYDQKLTDLNNSYKIQQKDLLSKFNRDLEKNDEARVEELKNNGTEDIISKYRKEYNKENAQDVALRQELQKITPQQIDDFVEQFSSTIILDLTRSQKKELREFIMKIQEESSSEESLQMLLKQNQNRFLEKMNLTKDQREAFEKNYNKKTKSQKANGFFAFLLKFLRNLFK